MAIDAKLTTEEVIKELAQIAGRPTEDEDEKEKVADEDDVDNEEAALLHEEATMTIEELLTRYGQNCHKGPPHSKSGAGTGEEPGSQGLNGEAGPEDSTRETPSQENGPTAKAYTGFSSNSERGTEAGQVGEPGIPTGEAGPSCSSASDKLPRVAKSKFFEDSEDESDEAEEEEEDSEVRACEGRQMLKLQRGPVWLPSVVFNSPPVLTSSPKTHCIQVWLPGLKI